MTLEEKLGTFHNLLNDQFLEADYALLKKKDPKNKILTKPCSPIQGREALLVLVELVGEKEITKHRKGYEKEQKKELEIARNAEQLSQKETLLEQLEEGKLKEVSEAVDNLPKDHLFLDDLVEALKEAEAAAGDADQTAKKEAVAQKEEILKLMEEDKLEQAESIFAELPEDFMFLTELAEAINEAKKKAAAEEAIEEAIAETDVIRKFLWDDKLEEARIAIDGLPDDHHCKKELVEAIATAEKTAGTGDTKGDQNAVPEKTDGSSTGTTEEQPAGDPAKKKQGDTQGTSSKKNKSTQG